VAELAILNKKIKQYESIQRFLFQDFLSRKKFASLSTLFIKMAPSIQISHEQPISDGFSAKKSTTIVNTVVQRPEATEVQSLGRAKDGRILKIREYPKFETLEEERVYRKQHLAAAFRVFADRGFDEGVAGHISVRDPILTDHFCE